jgi:hypothetical protein
VTRAVRVVTVAGATEARTMTKRTYGLDPVPEWAVIPRDGTTPAGYVALRTFIGPADARLGQAFQAFKDAGVTDVVVDLRYNGGGLVSTATLLANLLGGDRTPGDLMFEFQFNDFHASENWSETFQPPVQAIAPFRVAFVTTDSSASASELVPNVLEAWKQENVALVGGKTYGKPVGQYPFAYEACGTVVYLIAFRLLNADGDGGYYGGLPDAEGNFSGPLCAAADDLTHAQSDPQEASTAAALHWLATGTCPAAAAAAKPGARAALKGVPGADGYPEASEPDLAQRHVRGLF